MREKRFPVLLPAQKNIEAMMLAYPEQQGCVMGGFFLLNENRREEWIKALFKEMPKVHSVLRLRYVYGQGVILSEGPENVVIPVYHFDVSTEDEKRHRLFYWLEEPMDIEKGLYGFALFIFADGTCYGGEKFHHLIMDKTGFHALVRWQEKSLLQIKEQGVEAWRVQLRPDDRYIRLLEEFNAAKTEPEGGAANWLRTNFSDRSGRWLDDMPVVSSRAACFTIQVPDKIYTAIKYSGSRHQVSVESMWYLVVFEEICLRKGISHAVVGRLVEYRRRKQKDIVGLFSRLLPVAYTRQEKGVWDLCRFLMEQFLISLRYGEHSFQTLKRMEPGADIDFDVEISFHHPGMLLDKDSGYLAGKDEWIDTPLRIWINDRGESADLEVYYQTACYHEEEIRERVTRYLWLMEQICQDVGISELTLLTDRDKKLYELVHGAGWVNPDMSPAGRFLSRSLSEQERPKIILKDEKESWSYERALYGFYQAIDWLQEKGVREGDVIGICCERSVQLPVLMLAIQYAGAAFLPIAVQDSKEWREHLARECRILIQKEECSQICGRKVNEDIFARAKRDSKSKWRKDDCAYVMYTSGSSGSPKAVKIGIYALMCRLEWMYQRFGSADMTLQKTPFTFDVSIWELLLAPVYGGCLYLLPQGKERFPDAILQAVQEQRVSRIHFVPSMLDACLSSWKFYEAQKIGKSLQEIFVSGEALRMEMVKKVQRMFPAAKVINLYGPTECTIDVSFYECTGEEKTDIPIGRAVANTGLHVLSPYGSNILPAGVKGELCVTGDLVGLGYAGDDQGGYGFFEGKRMYRTGDMAQLGADGQIYFLGRADHQVKLRGMRIDTESIERAIASYEGISRAYVTVEGQMLVAYYEAEREISGLKERLLARFPAYHVPARFYTVPDFPLTPHGKLDVRKLLSRCRDAQCRDVQGADAGKYRTVSGAVCPVFTEEEKTLVGLIGRFFAVPVCSPDMDLFEAGLDSLTGLKIVEALRQEGKECSYVSLYRYPTIRKLAGFLYHQEKQKVEMNPEKQQRKDIEAGYAGVDYLVKRNCSHLFICIPFGGGGSEIFGTLGRRLSGLDWDIAVVKMSAYGDASVEYIAKSLTEEWKDRYESCTIFGYCVGSALAHALAASMLVKGIDIHRIYLAASLPDQYIHLGKRRFSTWDLMPDQVLWQVLRVLGNSVGKNHMTKKEWADRVRQFRRDTKRFFDYMEKTPRKLSHIPVTLMFGGRDPLTFGWKKRCLEWYRYFENIDSVRCRKQSGHYLLADSEKQIAHMIMKESVL